MPRPKSNRARNIRELKRAGDSLNSVLLHMFAITQSYEAHKEYQIKYFTEPTEHTIHMLDAAEYIATEAGKLQKLVVLMALDIDNN